MKDKYLSDGRFGLSAETCFFGFFQAVRDKMIKKTTEIVI